MVLTKMFGAVRRRVAHSQNLARISSQMQSPSSWRSCCVAAKEMTVRDALNSALDEDMSANSKVYLMSEEVGEYQGAYKVSKGLPQKFGPHGMLDTPITEILHLLDSRHETIMNQTMASSRLKVLNMETLGALETSEVMSISFTRLLYHGPKLYQMLGSKAKMNMRVEMQRPCSQMKSNLGYLRNVHRNPSPLLSRRMHPGDEIWNNLGYSRVCHRHQKLSIRQFSEAGHSFMKKFHFSTAPPAEGSSSSDTCNSSETISVTFIDKHGDKKTVKVPLGMSMLEAAHQNDIELEGACEGSLACSTCHVIVMDEEYYNKLPEPTDEENDMLDLAFGLTETSRLGCQVIAKPELEGMRLAIPSATRNFAVDGYVPKPH